MHKRRFGTGTASRFQEVQRSARVGIEIVKRDGCCPIVRWLGSRMYDRIRLYLRYQPQNAFPITNVDVVMTVVFDFGAQTLQRPAGITLRSKENCALIIIYTENSKAIAGQMYTHFRPDQTARTGY